MYNVAAKPKRQLKWMVVLQPAVGRDGWYHLLPTSFVVAIKGQLKHMVVLLPEVS